MASSKEYRSTGSEDNLDSEDGAESDHSMDQPPTVQDCVPPDASLMEITNAFISVFDRNIPDLQALIKKLKELIDSMEGIHRNTTIGSLSAGVIGAVGGITSIVGLILCPFTLGASLIVTGIGIGVSTAAGVTGAGYNITDMLYQRSSRTEVEETLKAIQDKLSPIIECVKHLELRLGEIQRSDITDSSTNIVQAGIGIGRSLGYAAESVRLINFANIGKVAAQASRAMKAAGAVTGVLSGLFLLLDIVFIFKDAKELREIDKEQNDGNEKSVTVKFVQEMRKACDDLKQAVKEIRKLRENLDEVQNH